MYGLYYCAGDTMLVQEQRRLSVWDSDGHFIRTIVTNFGNSGWFQNVEGISADCSKLLVRENKRGGPSATRMRAEYRLFWWSLADGVPLDTVMRFQGAEGIAVHYMGQDIQARVPWSANPVRALADQMLFFGNGDAAEFRLVNANGKTSALVRWTEAPRTVTANDRRLFESKMAKFLALNPDRAPSYPPLDLLSPHDQKPVLLSSQSG